MTQPPKNPHSARLAALLRARPDQAAAIAAELSRRIEERLRLSRECHRET